MKKSRLWLALLLLAPALTVGAEKYTNEDLAKLAPKRDAYTNADLDKLEPLKVQAEPIAPMRRVPVVMPSEAELDRAALRADQFLNRDLVSAEIDYWQSVIDTAHSARAGGRNGYPNVGGDTAEARERLVLLRRLMHMIDREIALGR